MKTSQPDLVKQIKNTLHPARYALRLMLRPEFRQREQQARVAYGEFKRQSEVMWRDAPAFPRPEKKILIVASNFITAVKVELSFVIALRMAGFAPVILIWRYNTWIERYFRLWDVKEFIYWDDFLPGEVSINGLSNLTTFEDVLTFRVNGARVGKYAASWVMRLMRVGSFDPGDVKTWDLLLGGLEEGARYAQAALQILRMVRPDTALFIERGYSPWGQLFDLCLQQGVDVIQWTASHKNNVLNLKRYNPANEHLHPSTLSHASWELVKEMPWEEGKAQAVQDELYQNYESGQWFGEVGTQLNKKIETRAELQAKLDLDPRKKTAVIFPHLFWDATFFFGKDLFKDYENWFVQAVQAAVNNPALNWVIKVHPANVVKNQRDGYEGEYSEIAAIRQHIGILPAHVKLINAESDISTFSLFSLMDYCLTVRGTVGIEASSFGIPVLTAGTGRYDHLGFTVDSESREEYLAHLAHLQEIEPLSAQQRELAQRFAYAILLMRPFRMRAMRFEYQKDATASLEVRFLVGSVRALVESPEIRSFAEWVGDRGQEDWLEKGGS